MAFPPGETHVTLWMVLCGNDVPVIHVTTVEPPFNKVLDITNENLRPGQNYSKMYGIEPRYNEP